jgi:hexosaminidase
VGAFYGTRTVLQLLSQGPRLPAGRAHDRSRYPERGLMLDIGRRPYPLRLLKAYVRELAYLKLNLLHLHLTDNERWAIASDSHPEVVTKGAYSKAKIRKLLRIARRYHVRVVPEIEFPGHAGTIVAAHPGWELTPSPRPEAGYHSLDVSKPEVRGFVRDILREYLPLFPGKYFDMGGDEYLTPSEYSLYPQLLLDAQRRYGSEAGVQDEINGFYNWIDEIVRRHGKTLRAWPDQWAAGNVVQVSSDIVADWWTDVSPVGQPATLTPPQLLASGHRIFNAGWFPTYFTGDLGPINGDPDPGQAYESWSVNQFCSAEIGGSQSHCTQVRAREPGNLGSSINVWDQHQLTDAEIADALFPRLRMLAQKTWDSPPLTPSWARFSKIMDAVGHAPGY